MAFALSLRTMEHATPKKTILVVDDEPEIRKLVSAMLTSHGYQVILADTGEQAVKAFRKQLRISTCCSPTSSPRYGRPTLADQLTELKPDLRVLFMSGYDNRQVVQKYVVEKGSLLLPKLSP